MKKILFFILSLLCCHELMNASKKRSNHRGFADDFDANDDDSEISTYPERPYFSLQRKNNNEMSIQDILKIIQNFKDELADAESDDRNSIKEKIKKYEDLLEQRTTQVTSISHALHQGLSRGMRGRGCTTSEDIPTIAVEAVTQKFFAPLGKTIEDKGKSFWGKVFNTIEDGATSLLELMGLTPTISLNDVVRWQTSCQSLADNYKDLRKSIETSESRATSMQLRSLLQDDDEESENEKEKSSSKEKALLIDPVWQRKQQGDLILLTSIVFKLKIKKHETSSSNYDLHAAIDRLQSDLTGIIEQIESVLVLRDLIDTTRTQLMISYFAAIDAGLTELGMIIAPDQFDPSPSRRKKNSYLSNDF